MLRLAALAGCLAALAPSRGAAAPAGVVLERYLDRTEGAFRVLVPKGWIAQGGIVRVNPLQAGGPGQAIEAKLDFAVQREREGKVAIRWLPSTNYLQPAPGVVTASVNGMPVARMPTPRDFATRALFPRLRPGARDVRVLSSEPRPDVVAAMRASDKARGLITNGARYHVAAEAVTLGYREGDTAYRELVFAAIEGIELMGTAIWSNGLTIAARAPEAEMAAASRIARVVVNSFALNPRWFAAEAAGQRYRAGVVKATQDQLARLDREITEHRQKTQAQIQDQQYLTLTGQDRWVNPHTGDVELGSNEWKHRWEDGSGQVIYTDDERWDPNQDPALKVTGFKRSPAQRR